MRRRTWILSACIAAVLVAAPAARAVPPPPPDGVHVTIRTTAHGIPHVLAADYRSLGYGYGWALAHDVLCPLAEAYVTVAGERSRFFGPDGSYDQSTTTGTTPNNLESDLFYAKFIEQGTVERQIDRSRPGAPPALLYEIVDGYAEGYNAALKDQGAPDGVTDPACKGQPWVRPIEPIDVWRRIHQLQILAGQAVALAGIAQARPPTGPVAALPRAGVPAVPQDAGERLARPLGGLGSNAIALGGDATADGHGLMLGNPHFPWFGSERFYQSQLTIPGTIDVAGSSLLGVPLIINGFTRNLAWAHTVSTARRFLPYQLTLAPGDPTAYVVDGETRKMKRTEVTVQVRRPDGTLEPRSHAFYDTEYGPVLTSIMGLPVFPWTTTNAYALFDANGDAMGRLAHHFFATNRAHSVAELDAIEKRFQGLPFANTLAADTAGDAYYADIGSMPNADDEKVARCNTPVGRILDSEARVPVLDGARGACAPGEAEGAAAPGILPPAKQPSLTRRDYVENSNDSYWLVNPRAPLQGYARIIGTERTPRLFRTRIGMLMLEEALRGGKLTPQGLMDLTFANRNYAGELWRDGLVELCRSRPTLPGSRGPVAVADACPALEAWDLHDDLDSRGALLFRRVTHHIFFDGYSSDPFAEPFDPADPLNTPRGLNRDDAGVQRAFADAVQDLRDAGIPFDAPVRDHQYVVSGGERIPLHGSPEGGDFNYLFAPFAGKDGWTQMKHGTSYVHVVRLTGGCPEAHSIQAYSQSTDPTSPLHADQTRLWSAKRWLRFPFCAEEIAADPALRVTKVGGGYPGRRALIRSLRVRRAGRRAVVVTIRLRARATVRLSLRLGRRVVRSARARGTTLRVRLRTGRVAPRRLRLVVLAYNAAQRQRATRRIGR